MALTTTPNGIWMLQALLGVETMPVALRLKPFVPSVHASLTVDTNAGPRPLTQTAEYAGLVAAGVIDGRGEVDPAVRDWMTVLGRPERQIVLAIRRPAPSDERRQGAATPLVEERALVVCRHRRWLAMAARSGDEVVIDAVGESDRPEEQVSLMCQTLLPAFGEAEPAAIEGVNVPAELLLSTVANTSPLGREAISAALGRLGLSPSQVDVITAAARLEESAMAVVAIMDHGAKLYVHPRVLTVVDTEFGRVSITYTTGADRRQWMSVWPASIPALREDLAELLAAPRGAA
jgi:hypothetical protein